jgi:hypothetical protein
MLSGPQEAHMSGQIEPGSRISDVIHILSDPTEYVRGILGNFVFYRFNPETSAIRIGVKGTGVAPNYKIEEPSVPVTVMVGSYPLEITMTARTFSGRDHREMVELDNLERHGENWSTASMSFTELKMLLSNLSRSGSEH